MTRDEVAKLIYVIRSSYPHIFAKYTAQDVTNMVSAWQLVLEDYTYSQGSAGLRIYLSTETTGFPPSPGQVIACIHKAMPQDQEVSPLEAWAMVRKGMRNAGYNAKEEFEKLPEPVQRALGSFENLKEMSQLDIGRVETVEQSHFIRQYTAILEQMREEKKIPQRVRDQKKVCESQNPRLASE